jgi:hypothetical protein
VSDDSRVPTLFLRDDMKGFIDMQTGSCQLETLLIPTEVSAEAVGHIEAIVNLVAPRIRIKLHVGTQQPVVVYKGEPHDSMQIEVPSGAAPKSKEAVVNDEHGEDYLPSAVTHVMKWSRTLHGQRIEAIVERGEAWRWPRMPPM